MKIGKNEQIALMTTDYGKGRAFRAGLVALITVGIPSMPLPPAMDEWKVWIVGILATVTTLLTSKKT
jgi:hypothetical protein